jgi:hypothetical protein
VEHQTHFLKEKKVQQEKMPELCEKIAELMTKHGMKVFDLEYINELVEKTILRAEKECSY